MSRGIYITANDRVLEQAIALLKSIRVWDPDTPVVIIPFDDNYHQVEAALREYGVKVYENLDFVKSLSQQLFDIFGEKFFNTPNKLRKQACWFGEFDEFIYIDTDIVVFEKIIDNLDYFSDCDFINCDYQYKNGMTNVFTSKVLEDGGFDETDLQDTFNSGFWASKKALMSKEKLESVFRDCAAHPEYFDFSQKTTDQPILNYTILKCTSRRLNLVRQPGCEAGNWAGSPNFKREGDRLIDANTNCPLKFLHWAGIRIEPGCPYWEIWEHYRYLNEARPERYPQVRPSPNFWQRVKAKLGL